jgi:hypothetical protein
MRLRVLLALVLVYFFTVTVCIGQDAMNADVKCDIAISHLMCKQSPVPSSCHLLTALAGNG